VKVAVNGSIQAPATLDNKGMTLTGVWNTNEENTKAHSSGARLKKNLTPDLRQCRTYAGLTPSLEIESD